jgi:hypothetical protein
LALCRTLQIVEKTRVLPANIEPWTSTEEQKACAAYWAAQGPQPPRTFVVPVRSWFTGIGEVVRSITSTQHTQRTDRPPPFRCLLTHTVCSVALSLAGADARFPYGPKITAEDGSELDANTVAGIIQSKGLRVLVEY